MDPILKALQGGGYLSGEALSKTLGITRAAVWKRVEALRQKGYCIESGGKRGYRLIPPEDSVDPAFWQDNLTSKWLGRPTALYSHQMPSTNTVLKQAAAGGAPAGTVALCETQTAGKGRLGRGWFSPPGQGIWVSLLLRPSLLPAQAPLITFAAALSMAQAVEAQGFSPQIKWPNDLVIGGKKICGILMEMSGDMDQIDYVVVGSGLNVGLKAYPHELKEKATSLSEIRDGAVPRSPILLDYFDCMERNMAVLQQKGLNGILPDYVKRSCTLSRRVRVTGGTTFKGQAIQVDETGALLVKGDDGSIHRVLAGDVSVRGVMGYV